MNSIYRLVTIISLILCFISCQKEKVNPDQSQSFIKFYGGSGDQSGIDLKESSDGGFIILGSSNSYGPSEDMYLVKTDRNGNKVWAKTYGESFADSASSLQLLPDGYLMVGTTYKDNNTSDIYMLKTDLEGHPVLTKTYGQPGLSEKGFASDFDNSNGFIIYGSQVSNDGSQKILLIRVEANGDQIWEAIRPSPSSGLDNSSIMYRPVRKVINIGYDDEFYFGYTDAGKNTPTVSQSFFINGGDGFAYTNTDIGTSSDLVSLKDFHKTHDGSYILCGTNTSNQLYILKGPQGVAPATWIKTYNLPIDTYKEIFINEASDGYLISATSLSGDIMLIKTNTQGDIIFTKTFGGTGPDIAGRVIPVSDGGIALTGTISFETNKMITLIKTDKNGEITLK